MSRLWVVSFYQRSRGSAGLESFIGREENLTVLSLQSPRVLIRQSEKGMLDLTSFSLMTEKGIPAF